MARIFQDSAGTIPVTTFDQPVGKIVRGAGTVDLVQTVSASRPTMARWPRGGRRNLLTNTDTMITSPWAVGGDKSSIIGPPDISGWVEYTSTATSNQLLYWSPEVQYGEPYTVTLEILAGSTARARFTMIAGVYASDPYASFEVLDGPGIIDRILSNGQTDLRNLSLTIPTRLKVTRRLVQSITTSLNLYVLDDSNEPAVGTLKTRRWQLQGGINVTEYQRVTTANDVTEEDVESLWHLYNDGGDSLQTDGPVPAGTYGYAYVDPYGEITFDTRVSDGINPVTVADDPGRYLDLILRKGDFSAGEKVAITDYWERRYK